MSYGVMARWASLMTRYTPATFLSHARVQAVRPMACGAPWGRGVAASGRGSDVWGPPHVQRHLEASYA
jgi:hypothetical protein